MNRLGLLLAGVALLLAPVGSAAATPELSAQAKTVVDYLLDDWSTHMHSTGIALGMQNLGMDPDDDLRLEVAEHFRANTGLANNLEFWGANNYVFSNEERRIVKALINSFDEDDELPTLAAVGEELAIPEERLRDRLAFIARAGPLTASEETDIGYELIEKYSSWGGPLRHNFHTITIGDGKPFDVW